MSLGERSKRTGRGPLRLRGPGRFAAAGLALTMGGCLVGRQQAPRPNVLIVTADSLRPDRLDVTEGGRTPSFAALARRGARFQNAFTVSPWTAPALVSLFTGQYPPTHGVVGPDDTTPRTLPTLPRLLGAEGWTLANFGFFTGVSYYRNLGLPEPAVPGGELAGAEALSAWLGTAPEPFLAWVHLIETHLPYGAGGYEAATVRVKGSSALERAQLSATVPRNAGLEFAPGDRARILALYDEDVVAMDRALGRILAALELRGLTGRTIVVFAADHGEELLDHDWIGHASTSGEATLGDDVTRVPLVFAGPGIPDGQVISGLAQLVDVAPTLLRLVGLRPAPGMQGESLVDALRGRPSPREHVFFDTLPGGHLTPQERRLERLQAAGDGRRLHAERTGAARHPGDPSAPQLAATLARWRKEQARARLDVLARHGGVERPAGAVVEGLSLGLPILVPNDGVVLDWAEASGTIRLAWSGPRRDEAPYWVEYEVGSGLLSARGAFPVEDPRVALGPFPVAFWNDISGYSPFRFRVVDTAGGVRSAWVTFRLAPAAAADPGPR